MNYYDFEDFHEKLNKAESEENNAIECEVMMNRSRFSLKDALNFDKKFINNLLKNDRLSKVQKHWIASMHNRVCEEYLDSNNTSKSFEEFLQERLGKAKYEKLVSEWLRQQGNEFFQRVGMEEEMKPSSIYLLNMEIEDEED